MRTQSDRDFSPNGLLSNGVGFVNKVLDHDRWSQAEARGAELLTHIQPKKKSDEHRNAVVSYLRRLITKFVPCQVFPFGSVPLNTYLPEGDIDLTAFCESRYLTDSLIKEVLYTLETEGNNVNAKFKVKEVQYIQAEVKIIKCLVDKFVVDISFNQLGGLGALCFLEEVDNLIQRNHLFKRSIILIKAWCYYESRILGSYHGLLSTYALETLVMYIFNVYKNTFAGPLEVLFRFLHFFSKFDWKNYCISLWGPVPIGSLPNMEAEPPREDCQELLFSEKFLTACKSCYGATPSVQGNEERPFVSKFFNIIDPLRPNNNLGRSISKGNFFRIKSAIAFGSQRMLRLLHCPEDNMIAEFDLFFRNTWDRNGNGYWIDAVSYNLYIKNKNLSNSTNKVEQAHASQESRGIYQKRANQLYKSKQICGTSDVSAASQTMGLNTNAISTVTMASDSGIGNTSSGKNVLSCDGQSATYSSNEVHGMHHFPGFYTSPEFGHMYSEVPIQQWYTGVSERESGQIQSASSMIDDGSSSRFEVLDNHNLRISSENQQPFGKIPFDWRSEDAVDSKNRYYYGFDSGANDETGLRFDEAVLMHREQLDLPDFYGYLHAPVNVNSGNVSFLTPPHVLSSGYSHENSFGMLPDNVPSFESFSDHSMPYSRDSDPFLSMKWFPSLRAALSKEEITEPVDYNVLVTHSDHERPMSVNPGASSCYSSWQTGSSSHTPKDCAVTTEEKRLNKGKDSDVKSRASSSYISALLSNSRTNRASSSFSNGPSSRTSQPDCVSGDWIRQSTVGIDLGKNTTTEGVNSYVQALKFGRQRPTTVSTSSVPVGPPCSSKRALDIQSLLPDAYGSSKPSFDVPTMLPSYNPPTETEATFTVTNCVETGAELGNRYTSVSGPTLNPVQHSDASHVDYSSHDAASGYLVKESSDNVNLKGDFVSHWLNLQFGKFCQNAESLRPFLNPSSSTLSRRQFPWHRKAPGLFNSAVAHGPPPVPVVPVRNASALQRDTEKNVGFWIPRFSDGTGTYLPNPITYRERYFKKKRENSDQNESYRYETRTRNDSHRHETRNQNDSHRHERKDNPGIGEEKLNFHFKERFSGRVQFYRKVEKNSGTTESPHQSESSQGSKLAKVEKDSKNSSKQPLRQ